jgi:hypothetical protein
MYLASKFTNNNQMFHLNIINKKSQNNSTNIINHPQTIWINSILISSSMVFIHKVKMINCSMDSSTNIFNHKLQGSLRLLWL